MQSKSSGRGKRRVAIVDAASDGRMRMPHERDESPARASGAAKPPGQARVIGQAHDDVARGLQDTDCRAQPVSADSSCPSPAPEAARSRIARRRRHARALTKSRSPEAS